MVMRHSFLSGNPVLTQENIRTMEKSTTNNFLARHYSLTELLWSRHSVWTERDEWRKRIHEHHWRQEYKTRLDQRDIFQQFSSFVARNCLISFLMMYRHFCAVCEYETYLLQLFQVTVYFSRSQKTRKCRRFEELKISHKVNNFLL